MILKRLKIIDRENNVDAFYLFAYVAILSGAVNIFALPLVEMLSALLSLIAITYRDEVLRAKELPIDKINSDIEKLKGDLSELQITSGLRR